MTAVSVVGETDDVYFDSARKRVYVIGAAGFISVVQQTDSNHYELLANVLSIAVRAPVTGIPRMIACMLPFKLKATNRLSFSGMRRKTDACAGSVGYTVL